MKIPYEYNFNFVTAIAAGGTDSVEVTVEAEKDFVIEDADASILTTANVEFLAQPLATTTSSVNPCISLVRIQVEDSDNKWSNVPTRMSNWLRKQAANWRTTRPRIGAGRRVKVTLYNDSGISILAQVTFKGYKLNKGEQDS